MNQMCLFPPDRKQNVRGSERSSSMSRVLKKLIHRLKETSVNSAHYQILICCRTFFLLFIRAQYESEPHIGLRCSCAIKLLHVLCCCHSVLQLGRSLFFSFLLFFLRYWCFITSVAVRRLAISYFAFFSAFVYYVTSFIPPSIFFFGYTFSFIHSTNLLGLISFPFIYLLILFFYSYVDVFSIL